jgi:flagellar motility protein MotE (MotC chaperone)
MKPAILGAIALVIGLGAGTGAKVMTTHPAPAVADSAKADSTHADSLKGEGSEGEHGVQQAGEAHAVTDTAVVASGAGEHAPSEAAAASPTSKSRTDKMLEATPSNAAAFAAALEARVDAAKQAAAKVAVPPVDTAAVAAQRRVAKIFTSMDAKAAAKVLEQMNDNDVHIILGYVGAKQAAAILSALPPERVAKLSKLEMGTR